MHHRTDSKDLDIRRNTTSTHSPQRQNVTASMVGLEEEKKTVTYVKNPPPKMENPRHITGNAEEEDCVLSNDFEKARPVLVVEDL